MPVQNPEIMSGLLDFAIMVVGIIFIFCGWLVLKFLKAWEDWDIWERENMLGRLTERRNNGDL
ncbi:hypothetical protein DXT88_07085 [Herbaspirillum lusitanum]|uniref:hypothetical protein n=1 Tax=Herbaspirillum lusitanum TaxID=213312 RepID=UPI0022382CE5|nr:hypothetical protein [Herbaspirillum lusitanum]MCW5297938.1 hypothetical protein [Herbaspirillum lusitanum]